MPTVVRPGSSRPATAATVASSHSASSRGVPSTGTSPERRATAVSASLTTQLDLCSQPRFGRHAGYHKPARAGRPTGAAPTPPGAPHARPVRRPRHVAGRPGGAGATSPRSSSRTSAPPRPPRRRPHRRPGHRARPGRRHPGGDRGDHRLRPHRRPAARGPGRGGSGRRCGGPPGRPGAPWPGSTSTARARSARVAARPHRAPGGMAPSPASRSSSTRPACPRRPRWRCSAGRRRRPGSDPSRATAITRMGASCRWPPATPTPAGARWWPTARACAADDDQTRTLFSVSCVARGDAGLQTGRETVGRTCGLRAVRRRGRGGAGPGGRGPGVAQAGRPAGAGGHAAGGHRLGIGRHPLPRGLRPWARGRPGGQGRLRLRRPAGRAGGLAPRHRRRRRHDGRGVGLARHRRRGPARPAQRADRRRGAHRLPVGPPTGPQGGSGLVRQRSSPELPPPAHGPHDEHVHRQRHQRRRTTSSPPSTGASTWPSSAVAR